MQTITTQNKRKIPKKCISIDFDTRMILNYAANRDPKIRYTISNCIKKTLKSYKPQYIIEDRKYGTEPIINI